MAHSSQSGLALHLTSPPVLHKHTRSCRAIGPNTGFNLHFLIWPPRSPLGPQFAAVAAGLACSLGGAVCVYFRPTATASQPASQPLPWGTTERDCLVCIHCMFSSKFTPLSTRFSAVWCRGVLVRRRGGTACLFKWVCPGGRLLHGTSATAFVARTTSFHWDC